MPIALTPKMVMPAYSFYEIGSSEKRTVRKGVFFAAIKNRSYLCSAFETQVQNIEY